MQKNDPKLILSVQIADIEEARTDDEIDADISEKKDRRYGRAVNPNRMPFVEAREFIRSQNIGSRGQYLKWHRRENPKTIPSFPYRVYKEWISWNDFLGNTNEFNDKIGTKWVPLLSAVGAIHSLSISTQAEWLEYYRLNKDEEVLKNIPARPDLVYPDWRSWGHWLGNRPAEALRAKQEAQRIQIYSIIHYPLDPLNVLFYGVDANATVFRERMSDQQFTVVKTYWYDPSKADQIHRIVEAFSSDYMGQTRQRLTPNVYDILWHLDQVLNPVLRGQV